ncbi:MAG: GrpB family protein [Oscillospiraceae bacterium]|nr:GrpB family protein [Oscillospiraceae bacterium]
MAKGLNEMTLEELWQLFPISLEEHDPCWVQWYREESAVLAALLPGAKISHIGSTAIPGIWAKPTVDILAEVGPEQDMKSVRQRLESGGWVCMAEEENRISFNKGYTENGFDERVFHLHLRHEGDNDEIYFRDYLISHREVAEEYERLKLSLWKKFEHDRDGYTQSKTGFVRKYTEIAKGRGQCNTP